MERRKANGSKPGIWGTFLLEAIASSESKSDQETKQSFRQAHGAKLTKNGSCPGEVSGGKDPRISVGTLHH